jgi:methylenetetrahydrofolate reductase (NADPH)
MALGQPSRLRRPENITRSIPRMLAAQRPSISFEFFPPKDDASEAVLWEAIRRLERVRPDFVSVTYGAGGTTQDRTVRVTERIARETTLTPLAHLTCVNASVAQLRQVVGQYAAAGVRSILALRGDPPGNVRGPWVAHPEGLDHAEDLVRLVRGLGDFTVGVAAFPDVHPESPNLEHDVEVLVRKHAAGASFAVTQMVFDADSYLRLRDAVAARCDLPITPGLMPVTNFKQIARMSELMGTPLPPAVVSRLETVADDPQAIREVGVQVATELAERMLAEGAPGLHFITMNRSTATLEVYGNLDLPVASVESAG